MSRFRFSFLLALLAAFVVITSQANASISTTEPPAQRNQFNFQPHSTEVSSATQDNVAGCVASSNPTGPGQSINIDSASHPNPWAGLIWVNIPQDNPDKTPTFCTDLVTGISAGACFQTDNNNPLTACPITWLLNNGYGPDANESNAENAARQASVWHFSDGVNVLASDPIYARTQTIINAVPQPCELPAEPPVMAIDPPSAINFLPGGESHMLTVTVTQDGSPVTNQDVDLSTDFGTLNTNSVTTNASGEATFTIESAVTGTANITASFPYQLPSGTRFTKLDGADDQQVIVLGTPEDGEVSATATKTWEEGTLIIAHKFNDLNTNGVQNSGEENLSGWEMTLQISDGQGGWTNVDSGNTDQNGNVIFNGLAPGTYRVVETQQPGWEATTPNPSNSVTLAAGEQAVIDFGNVPLAVIKVYKFNDLNGDGIRQDNEPLLDGWTMNINPAGNGIGQGDTANGSVSFIDLEPGTYTVWETQQDGWCATTDDSVDVTVGASDFVEVWFGNQECNYTLGDLVWYDQNQNGIQDADEPGVNGVDVTLYDNATCTGTAIDNTTTANGGISATDGWYEFTGLATGDYCVEFTNIPAGWTISPQDQGGDDTADSDPDPTTGQIQNINLTADDPDEDMGIYMVGSLGDTVWCESATNPNTTFDPADGDTGTNDVTVTLYEDFDCDGIADGTAIDTMSTANGGTPPQDGHYLFSNLQVAMAGDINNETCYVVAVDAADTDLGSCDNPITPTEYNPELDSDNPDDLDNDFGFDELYILGDLVWYDQNQDGIQDADEPGVNGVDVALYDNATCTGTAIDNTTTANGGTSATDGWYEFTGLATGDYCVEFTNIPAGWTISPQDQGGDDTADSDPDPNTGQIQNINLTADDPDEDMGIYMVGSLGDTVWCESTTNPNTTFDPADGDTGTNDVTVTLYEDFGCDGTADGAAIATMDTANGGTPPQDGYYLFSNLQVAMAGDPNNETCYVVEVDAADTDLGSCDNPITPTEYNPELDSDNPEDLDNDFGFDQLFYDWGDAPDSYGTDATDGGEGVGPSHPIDADLGLGANIDAETEGQPTANADGDDTNGSTPDDEDGVDFGSDGPMAGVCTEGNPINISYRNNTGADAYVYAWMDFNDNGVFDDPNELIVNAATAADNGGVLSTLNLTYDIPCDAVPTTTSYVRVRLDTASSSVLPTGPGSIGEVEDYLYMQKGWDFGDVTDFGLNQTVHGLPFIPASGGPARHLLVDGLVLGTCVDMESDGTAPANPPIGDDNSDTTDSPFSPACTDDEDGYVGTNDGDWSDGSGSIDVTVNGISGPSCVYGWIDWDRDGFTVDDGDAANGGNSAATVSVTTANNGSDVEMVFNSDLPTGANFPDSQQIPLRLRIVPGACGALGPQGPAEGGEVEDHFISPQSPTAVSLREMTSNMPTANLIWMFVAMLFLLTVVTLRLRRRPQRLD